jgi:hypothetical protein
MRRNRAKDLEPFTNDQRTKERARTGPAPRAEAVPRYGPVIVMNAPPNPSKVSVYVKLVCASVPGRIRGSQLGLGQRASSNTVEGSAVSDGTQSLRATSRNEEVIGMGDSKDSKNRRGTRVRQAVVP